MGRDVMKKQKIQCQTISIALNDMKPNKLEYGGDKQQGVSAS